MANIPCNVIEAQIYSLRIQESTLTWVLKRTSDLISPSTASGHATSQAPDYKEFLKDITEERDNIVKEIKYQDNYYERFGDRQ